MRLGCGKVEQEVRWEDQALLLNLGQFSQLVVDLVDGGSGGSGIRAKQVKSACNARIRATFCAEPPRKGCKQGAFHCTIEVDRAKIYFYNERIF